jgi:hypothetical protein
MSRHGGHESEKEKSSDRQWHEHFSKHISKIASQMTLASRHDLNEMERRQQDQHREHHELRENYDALSRHHTEAKDDLSKLRREHDKLNGVKNVSSASQLARDKVLREAIIQKSKTKNPQKPLLDQNFDVFKDKFIEYDFKNIHDIVFLRQNYHESGLYVQYSKNKKILDSQLRMINKLWSIR